MIVHEVTINVNQLCVRMLFNGHPTIGRVCETVEHIFTDHDHVRDGLVELVLSAGDDEEWRKQELGEGDIIKFSDDTGPIGQLEVQTRTLFDV